LKMRPTFATFERGRAIPDPMHVERST
jgi:hypothetical protein